MLVCVLINLMYTYWSFNFFQTHTKKKIQIPAF